MKKTTLLTLLTFLLFPMVVLAANDLPCPSGFTLTGNVCIKTVRATCRSVSCWCTEGNLTADGKNCEIITEANNLEKVDDSGINCQQGYDLINGTCLKYAKQAQSRDGQFYCNPDNNVKYQLVGSSCYIIDEENSINATEKVQIHENDYKSPVINPVDCSTLLGDPKIEGQPAYYIAFAFRIIRYAAIIVLIVFSVMDFLTATASSDDDAMKKAFKNAVIRLVSCIIIFLLPYLIQFILELIYDNEIENCVAKLGG